MKYQLASSSTEEGEVSEEKFPYYKSHLQFYYYPLTTKFIGNNTVPRSINYKSEGVCLKLKKDIKLDYPYVQFNILDSHKPFFDNKFKLICELERICPPHPLSLLSSKTDYKEIKKFDNRPSQENLYDRLFQKFFFKKEESDSFIIGNATKVFCLEDRVLEYIDSKTAFLFLRVAEEKKGDKVIKKYAFEDVFFSGSSFYEYLSIYQEMIIKSYQSEEIKTFSGLDCLFYVYSSTTFNKNGEVKRIFGTIDEPKNTKIICNKNGPSTIPIQAKVSANEQFLIGLDIPEGDYAINDKKVYKICNDGEHFGFSGLQYEDFLKNVWNFDN